MFGKHEWSSRRAFLESIGVICASGSVLARPKQSSDHLLAEYVGTAESIDVYKIEHGRRRKTQSVASERPCSLILDSSRELLFTVNQIDVFEGLPTGSVESYAVQPSSGDIHLISRRSLSLSATNPRHLAISPDRQYLVVAAYGGGAYNVLPIHPNGELGAVTQILKEIGCGTHPERQTSAHPHSVAFHPSGKFVLGTDLGSDRINVFRFESGRMTRLHATQVLAGSGPAQLSIDGDGSLVFVKHELNPILSCYRFDAETGCLIASASRVKNRSSLISL